VDRWLSEKARVERSTLARRSRRGGIASRS
jgi:hypothetical protein